MQKNPTQGAATNAGARVVESGSNIPLGSRLGAERALFVQEEVSAAGPKEKEFFRGKKNHETRRKG